MTLETRLEDHMERDEENLTEIRRDLFELRNDVKAMRDEFMKYKGFIGGVVFVISAIAAAIGIAIAYFK